jgi:hypothetical protein
VGGAHEGVADHPDAKRPPGPGQGHELTSGSVRSMVRTGPNGTAGARTS